MEILDLYPEACWDDDALKYIFWSVIDDILGQMLLVEKDLRRTSSTMPCGCVDPSSMCES